ncbi:hypothetical protein [uncultured Gammaproteobacteria bacterium]|nr:hypothetical protein [uncultured Gammaproteobacteria bacterium]CAC9967333.1 hypothetical protein [uncultured Gammaproteobacteria bacterium]
MGFLISLYGKKVKHRFLYFTLWQKSKIWVSLFHFMAKK